MATASPRETARAKGIILPDHTQLPADDRTVAPGIVLPDHTQLPDEDGTFVKNFDEHPQSMLLTDSLLPILRRRHPDNRFAIGQDSGIYWREADPPQRGAVCPDWCYVPNVPPDLNGKLRRSYVLWKELIPPQLVLEFSSEDGSEERDRTPWTGKFWIYEQIIRPPFYAIFVVEAGALEAYHLVDGIYEPLTENERGHFPVAPLGVELGVWQGRFLNRETSWMRWWDAQGNLLLVGSEREEEQRRRADEEQHRAEDQKRRADEVRQRIERLSARLRELGVDPDSI
jgi:Uma2 family endonuclease